MYNKRTWLNKNESHFTSSIVCFDGEVKVEKNIEKLSFIEITDCYHKIRLHVGDEYDYKEYIEKIDKIISGLIDYKKHLIISKLNT